jgi:hypothetical protein
MMLASENGEVDTMALLLDRGTNIDAQDTVRIPQRHSSVHIFLTTSSMRRWV